MTHTTQGWPSVRPAFRWSHIGWLVGWMGIGAVLRLTHLTHKPLWTDEFSTLVFSLGHSFKTVPLNTVISSDLLLAPLKTTPPAGMADVLHHLLSESNHPPLYFLLTHLWLHGFSSGELGSEWVSVQTARSLPALLGVLTIPALFGLTRLAFRSWTMAHIAALLMAVSPFGVYLAQEARHYTLPLLWAIASLTCLVTALRSALPLGLCWLWIGINALGIATHYFFGLVLAAEGLTLALWWLWQQRLATNYPIPWRRLSLVAGGTLAGVLVWLPILTQAQDSELTRWIYRGDRMGLSWLEPVGQAIAGWITMLYLLPVQRDDGISIAWAIALLLVTVLTVWNVLPALRTLTQTAPAPLQLLGGYIISAIALFFAITYITGMDLTSAFRYNFVYFPVVVVLMGAALALFWDGTLPNATVPGIKAFSLPGRAFVITVLLLSLLGAITVVTNLGYPKTHRPDLMVQRMQQEGEYPALVAIAHRTHGQTGRLMGIAWEWQRTSPQRPAPQFLLAHQGQRPSSAAIALRRALAETARPLNLWLINFREVPDGVMAEVLARQGCDNRITSGSVDGYRYDLYHCPL